jgi:plasmid stabilization system protein ParE
MKNLEICIQPSAQRHILDIWNRIVLDNPEASDRFLRSVDSTLEMLSIFPALGIKTSRPIYRIKTVPGYERYLL